jgi:hypothetical protein
VYYGRTFDELSMVPLSQWTMEELTYHHFVMSQLSPLMNVQGTSLHHDLIREIEQRGGLAAIQPEDPLA